MVPLGDEAQLEARFALSDIVLNLMQDRCTVCVKCTIGSKIIFTHPMEHLSGVGHEESRFGLFGDSVNVGAR